VLYRIKKRFYYSFFFFCCCREGGERVSKTAIVFTCGHAKPEVSNERYSWLGDLIEDKVSEIFYNSKNELTK
jgi:hypothetical protein